MSQLATVSQSKELTVSTVRKHLVNGGGDVTDQECLMFIAMCKYRDLNPWLREAYLIKYGSYPASMVVGKEVFTKRAAKLKDCAGWEAGVILQDAKGEICKRPGTCVLPGDLLIGGWAKIHRHNWKVALEHEVSMNEYAKRKKDGTLQDNWKNMPATMIRKVALVQALRDAFPEDLSGMYDSAEMQVDSSHLKDEPIELEAEDLDEGTQEAENVDAPRLISEAQRKRLFAIAGGKVPLMVEVCKRYGYESSKDIETKDYNAICEEVQKEDVKIQQ